MVWVSLSLRCPTVLQLLSSQKQKSSLEIKSSGKSEGSETLLSPDGVKANLEASLGALLKCSTRLRARNAFRSYMTGKGCSSFPPLIELPTLQWRSKALAIHRSCRSPTEKLSPFSITSDSSFRGSWAIWGEKTLRLKESKSKFWKETKKPKNYTQFCQKSSGKNKLF